jgi:uncharacterized low-complexity protein
MDKAKAKEGTCGDKAESKARAKARDGKCGEGKCGASKAKPAEDSQE